MDWIASQLNVVPPSLSEVPQTSIEFDSPTETIHALDEEHVLRFGQIWQQRDARLDNVSAIYTSNKAFAAVKYDGTVVTWGKAWPNKLQR